jgi:hypothetical protein
LVSEQGQKKNSVIMEAMKISKILASIFLVVALSSCGYDGHYRYPCQDPANWNTEDCKPPICTANGACPEDLVGTDVVDGTIDETVVEEETTNE